MCHIHQSAVIHLWRTIRFTFSRHRFPLTWNLFHQSNNEIWFGNCCGLHNNESKVPHNFQICSVNNEGYQNCCVTHFQYNNNCSIFCRATTTSTIRTIGSPTTIEDEPSCHVRYQTKMRHLHIRGRLWGPVYRSPNRFEESPKRQGKASRYCSRRP